MIEDVYLNMFPVLSRMLSDEDVVEILSQMTSKASAPSERIERIMACLGIEDMERLLEERHLTFLLEELGNTNDCE